MEKKTTSGYVHGFTADEEKRLYHQARYLEHRVHDRLPFQRSRKLLEVGAGVGAQTEILLRHFPELNITGVDTNAESVSRARRHLDSLPWAGDRVELIVTDAGKMTFEAETFDSAFLCWILEHVASPALVLSEVRRVHPSWSRRFRTLRSSSIRIRRAPWPIGQRSTITNSRSAEIRSWVRSSGTCCSATGTGTFKRT
jgi:2-polyprenyl-3-methyl-5-hydroxy-6-metoxy-1,4-benzoquinol methylase